MERIANYELKEDVDYKFIYSEEDTEATVFLSSGEFDGVSVKFSNVGMQENEDNTEAYLNFNYHVIESNGSLFLEDNEDFKNYLGDVLTSIIWNNIIKDKEAESEVE